MGSKNQFSEKREDLALNARARKWKDTLDKGQAIILQMQGIHLEPSVSDGDAVTVKKVPAAEVDVDDIILCDVKNKTSLWRISGTRVQSTLRILDVLDAKGNRHAVSEEGVLGKMVSVRRNSGLQEERGLRGFVKRLLSGK
jgi:hypothetical protein